jgi:hypothetical protein
MADDGALRARRHRLHKSGNHSLCRRSCAQSRQVSPAPVEIPRVPPPSGEFDARLAMQDLAMQLRAASAAAPDDAVLAREYRLTLIELAKGGGDDGPDPFAELLAELAGPVPATVGDSAH